MASLSIKAGSLDVFAQQMRSCLFSKEFSDVKFVLGEQRKVIHGHRIIIGSRCPLLHKLFQESANKPEVPIILAEVNPETFQQLLEFMYTNTVQLNTSSCVELLGTAMEYGLQDLQSVVTEFMVQSLDVDFSAEAMHAAVYFEVPGLEGRGLQFIAENAQQFFKSKCFLEMGEEAFRRVIECPDLDIDEWELQQGIFEWGQHQAVKTSQSLVAVTHRVVRHLRIAAFDVAQLERLEEANERKGPPEGAESAGWVPAEMLQFAWKFHAQINNDRANPLTGKQWASLRRGTKPLPHHKHLNQYSA